MDLTKIIAPIGLLRLQQPEVAAALEAHGGPYQFWAGEELGWLDHFSAPGAGPSWLESVVYRVKPQPPEPPSVNWAEVGPEVVAFSRDKDGRCWAYTGKPEIYLGLGHWKTGGVGAYYSAELWTSFRSGNCPWGESLILRPEGA